MNSGVLGQCCQDTCCSQTAIVDPGLGDEASSQETAEGSDIISSFTSSTVRNSDRKAGKKNHSARKKARAQKEAQSMSADSRGKGVTSVTPCPTKVPGAGSVQEVRDIEDVEEVSWGGVDFRPFVTQIAERERERAVGSGAELACHC